MNTKRDIPQIAKFEHVEASNAKRVIIVDTNMSLKLDHKEDSITTHSNKLVVSSIGITVEDSSIIPEMDCSSLKRVKLFVDVKKGSLNATITLEISPIDFGDVWFPCSEIYCDNTESLIADICARRLRVTKDSDNGSAEFDLHLVGQG